MLFVLVTSEAILTFGGVMPHGMLLVSEVGVESLGIVYYISKHTHYCALVNFYTDLYIFV